MEGFFTSVGEGRTLALLFALKDSPTALKDLKSIIPNAQTLKMRLERMEREGLVSLTVTRDGHKQVIAGLTDAGKHAAVMFSTVDMLVSPGKGLEEKSIDMKHFDTVLRMLYGKEYMAQKDIREVLETYYTAIRVLEKMESEGIVSREEVSKGKREIRYSLTPLGKQIAEVYQNVFSKIARS